jgi:hypothetical protein
MNVEPSLHHISDEQRMPTEQKQITNIRCLVPVWGYAYVQKFLEVALPSWLADGNLPAVSLMAPTQIVLLTSREDETYLRAHPAFERLSSICATTIHFIDHLITESNYSTTMTLAYTEAVRETGDDMLDTCFMFLVSDYIVSDGSFKTVIERIQAGRNGVLAGNFQVVEEDALPWLTDQLQRTPNALQLQPRDLMKWALSHLHPVTIANTANFLVVHNSQTNRVFWRVDNNTLIGRFYLMHMIAIRPELREFVIGSSCDYSFIPEMCPSNNVEILTDSDNYLVVELQPRNHESRWIKPGAQTTKQLAMSLGEWTTARHRENSATTVVFHADEIPNSLRDAIDEVDRFVAEVGTWLPKTPKPHRRHPYWTGAIAAFKESTGASLTSDEWRLVLGFPNPDLNKGRFLARIAERFSFLLFGRPPHVRPWHPRHPDYSLVLKHLAEPGLNERSNLLMIADSPTIFTATFADGGDRVVRIRSSQLLKQAFEIYEPLHRRFDVCLLEITEQQFDKADEILDRVAPMMRSGGTVLVSLINRRYGDTTEFQRLMVQHAGRFLRSYSRSLAFSFVSSTTLKFRAVHSILRLARLARDTPIIGLPALLLLGFPLAITYRIASGKTMVRAEIPSKGHISSALIRVTIDGDRAREAYRYSSSRVLHGRKFVRSGFSTHYPLSSDEGIGTAPAIDYLLTGRDKPLRSQPAISEQKMDSNKLFETEEGRVLPSRGLTSNQIWDDDLHRSATHLTRYRFIAKLLDGRKLVGELGCSDALGTRLVMHAVGNVAVYDANPRLIDDVRQRHSQRWPIEAHLHDIFENPLPHLYDGLYSLDMFERISRSEELRYLNNISASLSDDGILIVGSPSVGSGLHNSLRDKEDHPNSRSGAELKALLLNFFYEVFLFSMDDEVVHIGPSQKSDYVFALCCQKKLGLSKKI